ARRFVKDGNVELGVGRRLPRRRFAYPCQRVERRDLVAWPQRTCDSPPAMSLEFVDIQAARTARGVRIVVSGLVPSPWSEAAKGLFRVANVPVVAVRRMRDANDITAWTGVDNVPVVFHNAEPARTNWAAITTLAARLAGPDVLIPDDVGARAEAMGLLHEIAGEGG